MKRLIRAGAVLAATLLGSNAMALQIGDAAPDFTAISTRGGEAQPRNRNGSTESSFFMGRSLGRSPSPALQIRCQCITTMISRTTSAGGSRSVKQALHDLGNGNHTGAGCSLAEDS